MFISWLEDVRLTLKRSDYFSNTVPRHI